ncbi:MAG: hypothetical protein MI808_07725 [Pseudomonadales bacterium]|nr:hypothetical protein [Pseudomonadales bacterium]
MSEEGDSDKNVVSFGEAKGRVVNERKEKAAKALQKQFQTAMGWNNWPKTKKVKGSKGPKPKKGKKR